MSIQFENIFDVSAKRKNGRIISLKRKGHITGLTTSGVDPESYLQEIESSGVIPKDSITIEGSKLYLVEYEISIDDQSGLGDARVDLSYHVADGSSSGGGGGGGSSTTPLLRGRASMKQIVTEKDRSGTAITVEHTWPADDKGVYPDGTRKAGTTERQGGTIRVLYPMKVLEGGFALNTSNPDGITDSYIGRVNSSSWRNGGPREWLCTNVEYELIDNSQSPPLYNFTFTFERDDQTWDNDTTAVFEDPATGNPPVDLIDGVGIKQIAYYPEKNFGDDF